MRLTRFNKDSCNKLFKIRCPSRSLMEINKWLTIIVDSNFLFHENLVFNFKYIWDSFFVNILLHYYV